jgi:hypothetical protein
MAFGLQAVFFWAIFIYRKQISARLAGATAGRYDAGPVRTVAQKGADLASRPFQVLTALPGRGSGSPSTRQESALAGAVPQPSGRNGHSSTAEQRFQREQSAELAPSDDGDQRPVAHAAPTYPSARVHDNGNGHGPDRLSPPATTGRPPVWPERNGASGTRPAPRAAGDPTGSGDDADPATRRSESADVMRQARQLRDAKDSDGRTPPETER